MDLLLHLLQDYLELEYNDAYLLDIYAYGRDAFDSYVEYAAKAIEKNYLSQFLKDQLDDWKLSIHLRKLKHMLDSYWLHELIGDYDESLAETTYHDCEVKIKK